MKNIATVPLAAILAALVLCPRPSCGAEWAFQILNEFSSTDGETLVFRRAEKGGFNRKSTESLLWILYAIHFWLGIGVLIGMLSASKIIQ